MNAIEDVKHFGKYNKRQTVKRRNCLNSHNTLGCDRCKNECPFLLELLGINWYMLYVLTNFYKCTKKYSYFSCTFFSGAPDRTWTCTSVKKYGPEPYASANSATGANIKFLSFCIYTSRFLLTPLKRVHGLEPAWNRFHMDLNHARLPIPPYPHNH